MSKYYATSRGRYIEGSSGYKPKEFKKNPNKGINLIKEIDKLILLKEKELHEFEKDFHARRYKDTEQSKIALANDRYQQQQLEESLNKLWGRREKLNKKGWSF
ncbi:hypothetical protein [Cognatishimia sp.]|uniref:hypothetical protein n=1 Tax=Cognatishimia sp. TaxID=2211648 RepID=UPI003516CEDD|nr:hypothetical protein [Cognatishimia sp.]NQY58539.1 hypothetical protein [Cognatishimia sp.]